MKRLLMVASLTLGIFALGGAGVPSRATAQDTDISSPSIKTGPQPPPPVLVYSGAHFPLFGGPSSFSRSFLDDQPPTFAHRTGPPSYVPGSAYKRRRLTFDATYAVPHVQRLEPPTSGAAVDANATGDK